MDSFFDQLCGYFATSITHDKKIKTSKASACHSIPFYKLHPKHDHFVRGMAEKQIIINHNVKILLEEGIFISVMRMLQEQVILSSR